MILSCVTVNSGNLMIENELYDHEYDKKISESIGPFKKSSIYSNVNSLSLLPFGINLTKKVRYNGGPWEDTVTVNVDDEVEFKITITNIGTDYDLFVDKVYDILPTDGFTYQVGSSFVDGIEIYPNPFYFPLLKWEKLSTNLGHLVVGQSWNLTFTAIAEECGQYVNCANVTSHTIEDPVDPYDEDCATVNVVGCEDPGIPSVDIEKQIEDNCCWVDTITVNIDDDVEFRLIITNTGEVNLTNVIVIDDLPSFLTFNNDANITPSTFSDHHIEWNIGTLTVGSSIEITFSAHATMTGEGDNIASVTTCQGVDDEDDAHIIVEEEVPDVEIIKKVKDNGNWVYTTTVYPGDNVEFNLTITNTGEINLSEVLVIDDLPSFLTFNNDANITPSTFSDHHIEWNIGTLTVGSSIEITFSAHATMTGEGDNIASVTTCQGVDDEDDAHIIVGGMIIKKEVWDPNLNEWMEEINASVGDTVIFQITIYYYGNGTYNLYNIHVRDELPECLEYANNAIPTETSISTDGKTIWWNLSTTINAGESTVITFNALITETSGCGPCINLANVTASECSGTICYGEDTATVNAECPVIADAGGPYFGEMGESINLFGSVTGGISPYEYIWDLDDDGYYDDASDQSITRSWSSPGTYVISLKITDDKDRWDTDDTTVTIAPPDNSPPDIPSKPSGTATGDTGILYTYSTITTDPDEDIVKYGWDWDGDSVVDEWTGFYSSGTTVNVPHLWTTVDTCNVKVKSEDVYGSQSGFSAALTVVIYGNNQPNKPTISGPTSGKTGKSYTYSAHTIDPDGDQVFYWFDWDDGTTSGWKGPYNSGQTESVSHVWNAKGTYQVKVKSKDINGVESVWSNPLPISMPNYKAMDLLFLRFLERHPHIFPILRRILEI